MTLDVSAEDVATTADAILGLAEEETTSTAEGEAAPDAEEAQAAEDTPDSEEVSDDGPDEEAQEEPKPAGRSQKLQKLIDSKGGDEEKFAESMYQQMNSAAALAKKVEALEAKLRNVEAFEAEPAEPVEQHPDVVAVQQDIEALNAEAEGIRSRKHLILVDLGKLERRAAYVEGQAAKADDYDKNVLQNEKYQLDQLVRALETEYRQLEFREPRVAREMRDVQRQLSAAKQKLEAERAFQRNRALEEKAYGENFRSRFESKVNELSDKFSIPAGSRDFVMELAKAKTSVFLRGLDPESPGLHEDKDLETFVSAILSKYVEDRGLVKKAQFNKLSKAKLATTGAAPAPANKPVIKSPMPDAPKTAKEANSAQFWKNRAAKILG